MTTNNDKPRNGNGNAFVLSTSRKRSLPHPRSSLKHAEEFARVVYKEGPRRCDQDAIAKEAGFSGSNNGSFNTLRATTQQFGMIVTDGQTISVSEDWINVFLHDDRQQLRLARQKAMYQPDLYKQLIEEFADRQLPSIERLAQQLHINPKYGILKDAADVAAKVFYESAFHAGMINERNYIQPLDSVDVVVASTDQPRVTEAEADVEVIPEPVREANPNNRGLALKNRYGQLASPPPPSLADQVKIDIHLENDQIMHIEGPRRLLREDKERIKQYINLWLEERVGSSTPSLPSDASDIDEQEK